MQLRSFFLGGFECSSHRRFDGRRLDLIRSTGHEEGAADDYRLMARHGLLAARDGVRWHRIETNPGRYDWSSLTPLVDAAHEAGVEVAWDLCHYGWPDHLDIWSPDMPQRFANFAAEAAQVIHARTGAAPLFCAVNEISYWAWAGGDVARMNPLARGRGGDLKRQLVRMSLAATRAIQAMAPGARFVSSEPLIHVVAGADGAARDARAYHDAQFEAVDMLLGRTAPELGGFEQALDVVGVNFYPENQWFLGGPTIPFGHSGYEPLSALLMQVWRRYGKPILMTETGAEGSSRAAWLHYVCAEVREALALGAPIIGVCLYPVLDYPGWDNDRHCPVGLFSMPDARRRRDAHRPLAEELARQQALFRDLPDAARKRRPERPEKEMHRV